MILVPGSKGLPIDKNGKQKTSPGESLEIDHWEKLYHAEVERRKKLQTDLLLERDRNKQLHLQLQQEKNEKAKFCQQIGDLQNKLALQKVSIYQNFCCFDSFPGFPEQNRAYLHCVRVKARLIIGLKFFGISGLESS